MKNWFANLIPPRSKMTAAPPAEELSNESIEAELLNLQKENQSLRIDLAEREQSIGQLKQEIERLRYRQEQTAEQMLAARLESLFGELGGPASQILTQADLLENQQKPVQARDVLAVARRMVRTLERNGVVFEGVIGQQAEFDSNRHTPIQSDAAPRTGHPVTVRFPGVSYRGKMIVKAIVE